MIKQKTPRAIRDEWRKFYREMFRMDGDFSRVVIPKDSGGYDWESMVAQNITIYEIIRMCRRRFQFFVGIDLGGIIHERNPEQNYAVRIMPRWDATEIEKEKGLGQKYITLIERLIFELKLCDRIGSPLDRNAYTTCLGSLDKDGNSPRVLASLGDNEVCVISSSPIFRMPRSYGEYSRSVIT